MKAAIGCLIGLVFSVGASASALLEGRVRLASGEAVAQAQVQVFDMTALQRGAVAQTMTDSRGYFALPLAGLPGLVLPKRFELGANYPNPFNPSTLIPYHLAASSYVRLEVFNLLGQRIATLVEGEQPAGVHTAVWDATDGSGQAVGAGGVSLPADGGRRAPDGSDGVGGWAGGGVSRGCFCFAWCVWWWWGYWRGCSSVWVGRFGFGDCSLCGCRFGYPSGDGSGGVGGGSASGGQSPRRR